MIVPPPQKKRKQLVISNGIQFSGGAYAHTQPVSGQLAWYIYISATKLVADP